MSLYYFYSWEDVPFFLTFFALLNIILVIRVHSFFFVFLVSMLHQEIWEKYCSWSLIEEDDIAIKDKVGRLASLLPRNHEKRRTWSRFCARLKRKSEKITKWRAALQKRSSREQVENLQVKTQILYSGDIYYTSHMNMQSISSQMVMKKT